MYDKLDDHEQRITVLETKEGIEHHADIQH